MRNGVFQKKTLYNNNKNKEWPRITERDVKIDEEEGMNLESGWFVDGGENK